MSRLLLQPSHGKLPEHLSFLDLQKSQARVVFLDRLRFTRSVVLSTSTGEAKDAWLRFRACFDLVDTTLAGDV